MEQANSKNMLTLRSPVETTRDVTEGLIFLSEVEGVFFFFWKGDLYLQTTFLKKLTSDLIQGGVLVEERAAFQKDTDKVLSCLAMRNKSSAKVQVDAARLFFLQCYLHL